MRLNNLHDLCGGAWLGGGRRLVDQTQVPDKKFHGFFPALRIRSTKQRGGMHGQEDAGREWRP